MANLEHTKILDKGVEVWNRWREENPRITPDLRNADLSQKNLQRINFSRGEYSVNLIGSHLTGADLTNANLNGACLNMAELTNALLIQTDLRNSEFLSATLYHADLSGADCTDANFWGANLSLANLQGTNFNRAILQNVNLYRSDLTKATLIGADLFTANLTMACVEEADFSSCKVFGISAWALKGTPKLERDLRINYIEEPTITVDNIEVAQFIYLLLNNKKIRQVIDTITSKAVLILGRFTPERKETLDAIKQELRQRNYLPLMFDFEKPKSRDLTETVSTLAHMSRFIIADLTDAKSIPQELLQIIPDLQSVPVQPILLASQSEYAMFEHFTRLPWVLQTYLYNSTSELLNDISTKIIEPAEAKVLEMKPAK